MAKMTLRAARVNVDLSQKEAADALGISNKTLCAWETGKAYPRASVIPAICKLYCIAYDDLIFFSDKPL